MYTASLSSYVEAERKRVVGLKRVSCMDVTRNQVI